MAETFSTSPLKPLNGIQRNLTGSKISMSSTKFVFFRPIGKARWPVLASDWLRHFRLLLWNHWTEFNETSQEARSQVLYQVCVFRADQKNKMAALASEWLRHFRLLLWKLWTEFNETWQKARSQCPLPSLCFLGRSEKQDGHLCLWLRHFRLLLWNRSKEFNETWQEARSQCPLPSLCFFGPIIKQKWPPWLIPQKGGTLYLGARYVALWASCFTMLEIQ